MKRYARSKAHTVICVLIIGSILIQTGCRKSDSANIDYYDLLKAYVAANATSEVQKSIDWSRIEKSDKPELFYRVGIKKEDFSNRFILFKLSSSKFVEGAVEVCLSFNKESLDGLLHTRPISVAKFSAYRFSNGFLVDDAQLLASEYDDPTGPPMLAKIIPDPRGNVGVITMQYSALYYINIRQAYDALGRPSTQYQLTGGERKNDYGGGTTYTSTVTGFPQNVIFDDDLNYEENTIVDIERMISCFNAVPDQGADCSITIYSDLPVNERPDYLVNYKQRYAGHCFLRLRKSNQGKTVTQNIGFYPNISIKSMATTIPITGRFVNDQIHGYNASFEMKINFIQLSMVLQEIRKCQVKRVKYDVDGYNCADFALQMFNLVRPNDPLSPQKYQLPDAPYNPLGTNLPHGVYRELTTRKKKNAIDRPQITISTSNLYSDLSSSACR